MESELYTVVDENNNEARKETYLVSADFNSSEVVFQDSELFDMVIQRKTFLRKIIKILIPVTRIRKMESIQ